MHAPEPCADELGCLPCLPGSKRPSQPRDAHTSPDLCMSRHSCHASEFARPSSDDCAEVEQAPPRTARRLRMRSTFTANYSRTLVVDTSTTQGGQLADQLSHAGFGAEVAVSWHMARATLRANHYHSCIVVADLDQVKDLKQISELRRVAMRVWMIVLCDLRAESSLLLALQSLKMPRRECPPIQRLRRWPTAHGNWLHRDGAQCD